MGMHILVVDDSSVMRQMIIKALNMSGLPLGEIHQAGNGREGLDALDQHWIDLVILDINMPVMNGEEMMNEMKKTPAHRDIPVVVVSTEGSATRIQRMQALGARFVHKPFTPELIRDTIQSLLVTGDQP
ncbi:response regulator [Desulfatirhabdium butyrativorans]|uniref:response regulator n=1 Tax=Desulfatirhabdium butyrativorans TaxID=340467 RepID=UPI000484463A|nr:response regulator [Desulfatirhabdium butyrativorans]